jgi:hypothetical protein
VLVESEVDDTRLDGRPPVFDIQGDDFLQPVQTDDDDIVRECPAGQSGTRAARDEGDPFFGQQPNH